MRSPSAGSPDDRLPDRDAAQRPCRRIDPTIDNLVSHRMFRFVLGLEVQKAVRLRYSVGLMSMLLKPIGSAAAQPDAVPIWKAGQVAAGRLRSTDLVSVTSASAISLLLIDADGSSMSRIARRVAEGFAALPVDGHVGALTWTAGGASYPADAGTSADLLRRVSVLSRRAAAEGAPQLYLD